MAFRTCLLYTSFVIEPGLLPDLEEPELKPGQGTTACLRLGDSQESSGFIGEKEFPSTAN